MTTRKFLLATSVLSALIGFGQAHAQAAAGSGTQVGEVVVTAQRRSERLLDVPITVAVMTGTQLAQRGVVDVVDLQRLTAGVQMTFGGGYLAPSVRGISANVTTAAAPANIAFYVDGIYQASQQGTLLDLADIQDVEVLKGPQGTLYGQNAEGGAIVITTLEPKFRAQGKLSVSYGNYNDVRVVGYETAPITDAISQSLSGVYEHHEGFQTNVVTGKPNDGLNEELLRGKLLFKPNDLESITFAAYYSWHHDSGIFIGSPFHGMTAAANIDPALLARCNNQHVYCTTGSLKNGVRNWGADITGLFDVGLGKLTWQTSFNDVRASDDFDPTWSPWWINRSNPATFARVIINQGNFVSRPIGPVEFTTGVFYEHFNELIAPAPFDFFANGGPNFGFGPGYGPGCCVLYPHARPGIIFNSVPELQAYRDVLAGYLEGTWHVTSAFTVTVGGRYSTDTMHGFFNGSCSPQVASNPACNNAITPGTPGFVWTEVKASPTSWNNFTPRVTARYKITPTSNVYASFSEGYRSGTLNTNGVASTPAKPETLDAFEVGYKGTLFDRLTIDLSAFDYKYHNKLELIYLAPEYIITNAKSAGTRGVDLDATLRATPELTLTTSVEYLEATFGTYGSPNPNGPGCDTNRPKNDCASVYVWDPAINYANSSLVNLSHRQMDHAPKWSGSVSADYHHDTNMGLFTANISAYYESKMLWDENGAEYQKPYATVDAELGFTPASLPHLRFVLWGKNLTDTAYIQSTQETGYGLGDVLSLPRQFGGRVELKFGRGAAGGTPAASGRGTSTPASCGR